MLALDLERVGTRGREGMTYARGFGKQQQALAPQSVLAELSQMPIPEAVEDEYGILSCIFNSYDAQATFKEAASLLKPDHFLTPTLQDIWRGMLKASECNLPAEFKVQANYLQDFANINSATLKDVLGHISESLHDPDNIAHYAERIVRKAESRQILGALATSARAALDSSVSPEEALILAENSLRTVREGLTTKSERRTGTTKELGKNILDHLEQIALGQRSSDVIKTNQWYEFDQMGRGARPGEIIVFAAPPGGGKTTTAAGLANALSKQDIYTLWVSLEDSPEACYAKILATEARMSVSTIVDGDDINLSDVQKLKAVQESLQNNKLVVVQPLTMTIEGVEQAIAQAESDMRKEYGENFPGFRAILFDYLQYLGKFVEPNIKTSYIDSLTVRLGHIVDKMNATLYAFAQYETELVKSGKRPEGLGIFADCKAIAQNADQVWAIHSDGYAKREDLHTYNTLEYICLKNRRGATGAVKLGIKWAWGWIYSLLDTSSTSPYAEANRIATEKLPTTETIKQITEVVEKEPEEDLVAKYNDPSLEVMSFPEVPEQPKLPKAPEEISVTLETAVEVLEEVVEPEAEETPSSPEPTIAPTEVAEGTIVLEGVEYQIGEEVLYKVLKKISGAKILGWCDKSPDLVRIEYTESIPDPRSEYSGKKYLRETGEIHSVHPTKIRKQEDN